jgi:hypothetical protein
VVVMALAYLVLVEMVKRAFYRLYDAHRSGT